MQPTLIEKRNSLFIIDKPPGLSIHPTANPSMPSVTAWIQRHYGCNAAPVHRIDKETSGVVLLSTDRSERSHWGNLFSTGRVEKVYVAYVLGRPPTSGVIDIPLYDRRRGKRLASKTHYEMQHCFADCAYIAVSPHTGRKHQIRKKTI